MKLTLDRKNLFPDFTRGELYADGVFQCFVCEDIVRGEGEAKVYGKTAIPAGTYDVVVTFSNRFKRQLPQLVDVPGFEGIRIHPGNTAEDTDGCLLPGTVRTSTGVGHSNDAFVELFARITKAKWGGERITITITNPAPAA
jgi:hypothetical protein